MIILGVFVMAMVVMIILGVFVMAMVVMIIFGVFVMAMIVVTAVVIVIIVPLKHSTLSEFYFFQSVRVD